MKRRGARPEERRRSRHRLDPGRDPVRWEATVERIVQAAEPELRRRRRKVASEAPGLLLDRWAVPLLAAAASLIVLAGASLLRGPAPSAVGTGEGPVPRLEDALFPPVVARWIAEETEPTVEDVVFASSVEGAP